MITRMAYKVENDYDHSLYELMSHLKEWKECSLARLKEIRSILGLNSTDNLPEDWESQLNDVLVTIKSKLGLENLKVEALEEKLGQSKLSDISGSDNLEKVLEKNKNLEVDLQNRIKLIESQFKKITEELEQKKIEKKKLENSLEKAEEKLTELKKLSQEKNQLIKEMKEMTISRGELNQSLEITKEELMKTSSEMSEVKQKIEQLEKELKEKNSSLERILASEPETYQNLIQNPPQTPKLPDNNS